MDERLILFVCTGNICRSPMAEYLLREQLRRASGWRVGSAGTSTSDGLCASYSAVKVLDELGIDMTAHRSQAMTHELAEAAEVIVAMTIAHREILREQFPESKGKVHLLKSFDLTAGGWDIDDPIGLTVEVYRGIRDEIRNALPGLVSFLHRHGVPKSRREGGWAHTFDL